MKFVLVDTWFWFALFNLKDFEHHKKAVAFYENTKQYKYIVPWPSMYETLNTEFVSNSRDLFFNFIKQHNCILLDDTKYREKATELTQYHKKNYSLVDSIIRIIIEEKEFSIAFLASANYRDFADICSKYKIEMVY